MSCNFALKDYMSNVLIETGSGTGGGIARALEYGFKQIHSIEIDESRYKICKVRFENFPDRVFLYLGSSRKVLSQVLEKISVGCTILLDAHIQDFGKERYDTKCVCPVIEEIEQILEHSKKLGVRHTILVDDVKFFNGKHEAFGEISLDDISATVQEFDSSYTVYNKGRYLLIR